MVGPVNPETSRATPPTNFIDIQASQTLDFADSDQSLRLFMPIYFSGGTFSHIFCNRKQLYAAMVTFFIPPFFKPTYASCNTNFAFDSLFQCPKLGAVIR